MSKQTTDFEFMSVRETADILGVSAAKIYRLDRTGNGIFKVTKLGRRVLVDRSDFERYVSRTNSSEATLVPRAPGSSAPSEMSSMTEPVGAGVSVQGTSYGQRELILPASSPRVVMFMSWL